MRFSYFILVLGAAVIFVIALSLMVYTIIDGAIHRGLPQMVHYNFYLI